MQVSSTNDVKIYNLSAGRSLPEWLSDRKKRMLAKKNAEIRHRIELIQDFEMPIVSTNVAISRDGQYVMATGTYKPRVRCYEVSQLSMKFERCFDSDVVTFDILSDDYTKMVFLHCDRYVEFHAAYGRYHRIRIPKFGRDMAYLPAACELYFGCDGPEVYRLSLDQGRFMNPIMTEAAAVNVCRVNSYHNLVCLGTQEGKVEAFDPRSRSRVGTLECALNSVTLDTEVEGMPSVTALTFKDALTLGVGTATGQILLFDIRSDKPLLVKDHLYGLPVKKIAFHSDADVVMSMDSKVLKLWDRTSGKAFTSVTPGVDLNDLCLVGNSGLFFLANEDKKVLSYYIPSLGPAPRWCSFLDNLTEELEETHQDTVYDDYKFVTQRELENLGLGHLVGTNLLRAYMHGYFLDMRLYHKAKALVQPFAYDEYRKKKIRDTVEAARKNRVESKLKLPTVNKELAKKLQEAAAAEATATSKKAKKAPKTALLEDTRFKAIFENPDFEVDPASEEYRLLNPLVKSLEKRQKKKVDEAELQGNGIMDLLNPVEQNGSSSEEESSDDDRTWTKEVKKQHRMMKHEAKSTAEGPKMYELKSGVELHGVLCGRGENVDTVKKQQKAAQKLTLAQRLDRNSTGAAVGAGGNKMMTFELRKTKVERDREEKVKAHMVERRNARRSAKGLKMSKTGLP
ncbi:nucleolar protein 10-like [Dermacentor silvarum]|uniref:nucleolar protein 10-like n=1 Tax=Dermacentor silvarum TaxID=543639 RepID=UPI0018993F88|nr:nucleolar protein 10-like [Dermacentor silvarum]